MVAIKMLDPRGATDWKAHELFEREASVLRALRHHGIPEIHDVVADTWAGAPATFLVMEYIEGVSIARLIEDRRALDPEEVTHLFLELLGILDYLHGRVPPILHRDIKPSNIIVRPDGQPAVVDFGSVRRVFLGPDEAGSTVAGTYGYMPYEQYMGQATPASDLYALAATFLHLLTGRAPREHMTDEGRIEVPAGLPGDHRLRPILVRLLRPSPAERFAGARDVRHALLSATATAPASSPPMGLQRPPVSRVAADIAALGPVPRPIEGSVAQLLERACPSALELMDTRAKPSDEPGLFDWVTLIFVSVLTAGTLPIVFTAIARARRRRLRRFLRDGLLATAEILAIQPESIAFEQHLSRVSYRFEADGAIRRDVDSILPVIADRWQPGDTIQVLYLADLDYDSVIISTS
jgi:serine/threonine protein kinase